MALLLKYLPVELLLIIIRYATNNGQDKQTKIKLMTSSNWLYYIMTDFLHMSYSYQDIRDIMIKDINYLNLDMMKDYSYSNRHYIYNCSVNTIDGEWLNYFLYNEIVDLKNLVVTYGYSDLNIPNLEYIWFKKCWLNYKRLIRFLDKHPKLKTVKIEWTICFSEIKSYKIIDLIKSKYKHIDLQINFKGDRFVKIYIDEQNFDFLFIDEVNNIKNIQKLKIENIDDRDLYLINIPDIKCVILENLQVTDLNYLYDFIKTHRKIKYLYIIDYDPTKINEYLLKQKIKNIAIYFKDKKSFSCNNSFHYNKINSFEYL
jgi:hypothetical protein